MSTSDSSQVQSLLPRLGKAVLRRAAKRLGYKPKNRPFSEFIAFKETLRAAKAAGLSVGEYIERKHLHGSVSALDQTMAGLTSLGLFDSRVEQVLEIGPGSGRYLERMLKRFHPRAYQIYETSHEWRGWLVAQYKVAAMTCDGTKLSQTESSSMGLVHANKVFPGLPTLITISYLEEMARVVGKDGWVVFDIMTETCFSGKHLQAWFEVVPWDWAWSPHMIARDYVIELFAKRGINLAGSFQVPLYPAISECMVFRKAGS